MLICPVCSYQNPNDTAFCINCASALSQTCPSCGHQVPAGNKFCGNCGKPIDQPTLLNKIDTQVDQKATAHERMVMSLRDSMPHAMARKIEDISSRMAGLRRDVTVLQVNVSNFSNATRSFDTEEVYFLIDEIMRALTDTIYKYEGTIDQYSGDSLMALFGLPINHENDPERALRAALETLSSIIPLRTRLRQETNQDINIKIGINTGIVIAGNLGSQHHMEYTVVGDTVNLASRLANAAEPGQVLVSFSTYQRTRPIFNYQKLPSVDTQEDSNFSQVYQLLNLRSVPGQVRGLPGLQVPMIGRKEYLQSLIDAQSQAVQKKTYQVAFISGEAGFGKTRLVTEFRNALSGQAVNFFSGTCAYYMRIAPYRVVADLIRNTIHIAENDPEDLQRETLRHNLNKLNLSKDIYAYLLNVLGLSQQDTFSEIQIKMLDPAMRQRQIHSALRTYLDAQATFSPTILVFDDLHWVDPASKSFLEYYCQALDESSIMLVMVARDFSEEVGLNQLLMAAEKRKVDLLKIQLKPLSMPESHLLLDQLLDSKTFDDRFVKEEIISRSGGNPYYAEELVRALIDNGAVVRHDSIWKVIKPAGELVKEIPGTLQDIILARFDRLPDRLKETLRKAAVIGATPSFILLQSIAELNAENLLANLNELVERGFLAAIQTELEVRFSFKHPLLQETIYRTMLKRDLRILHLRIARAIEASGSSSSGDYKEILAHHYSESSTPVLAIPYLLASAEKALQRFANETGAQYYSRALKLMESEPVIEEEQICEAKIGLAKAQKYSGELEEAAVGLNVAINKLHELNSNQTESETHPKILLLEGLRELADIQSRMGDLDRSVVLLKQGLDLLGANGKVLFPAQWRRLIDRLSWVYFRQSNLEEAFNLADLALFDVDTWEGEDPITVASLTNTLGGIYYMKSRYKDAIHFVERSLDVYKNLNYAWGMAVAFTNLGVLRFASGKFSEAITNLNQADELRIENGYLVERPTNLKNLGEILICTGDFLSARQKLQESLDISNRFGLEIYAIYAELGLCRVSIQESNISEAEIHLEIIRQFLDASKDEVSDRALQFHILKAMVLLEQGQLHPGLEIAQKASRIAAEIGFQAEKCDTQRIMGAFETRLSEFDAAEDHLKSALEFAQSQQDLYRQAQTFLELCLLYIAMNGSAIPNENSHIGLAKKYINQSIEIFEILGAKHELARARVIRDSLPDSTRDLKEHTLSEVQTQIKQVRAQLGLAEGEWYQTAVLVIKILPIEDMDQEFVFETIALFLPPLIDFLREFDGRVIRRHDGLTAIFGAPAAHENDPELAVESAIKVVNFYQDLFKQTELPITIQLGISMGKIVAGFNSLESAGSFIAAGEPIQEATLLADAAPSGRIWTSRTILNATAHRYEYSHINFESANFVPGSLAAQLEGLRDQIGPMRGLIGLKTQFVGRKSELLAMQAFGQNLQFKKGGLILIEGDPGIGKSRLMREFVLELSAGGALIWWASCTARRSDFAFSLFSDLILQAFDLQANLTGEQISARIDQKLKSLPADLLETYPYLQILAGVRPTGLLGEKLTALEPEQLRRQIFVAVRKVIVTIASKQPLALVLDDLQWIDPISADLLTFLLNMISEHPVLIIGAMRSTEESLLKKDIVHIREVHFGELIEIRMNPLSMDESHILLDKFLSSANLPRNVIDLIVRQSGGNPYFIEEFVRMLLEKDFLRISRDGNLEINQSFNIESLNVPPSLEMLIRARVDSLPDLTRKLLQVASIIGRTFNAGLLSRVAKEENFQERLKTLQNRGMLSLVENDYYEFSHPLIETIVYNSVLRAHRDALHRRTAQALEAQWSGNETEHAEDLAYHFERGGENHKAQYYLILSGERAAARHANEAALKYFERAAELLTVLPKTSVEVRWRIACGLGEVYQFVGNYDASKLALQSGLGLIKSHELTSAQQAGLYRRLGETALKRGEHEEANQFFRQAIAILGTPILSQDLTESARNLARSGWSYFRQAKLEDALRVGMQARIYAQQANSPGDLAMVLNLLGGVYYRMGQPAQAVQMTQEAMKNWEEIGYSWGVAVTLGNLGILEVAVGNWDAAYDFFQKSLILRQEMGDVEGVATINHNLGSLERDRGNLEESEVFFRNSLAVARPFQMSWHIANSSMGLAQALLKKGQADRAMEVLQENISLADEIEARDISLEMRITQAEIFLHNDDLSGAFQIVSREVELAGELGIRLMVSTAARIGSECLIRQDKLAEAQRLLSKSWEVVAEGTDELEIGRVNSQAYRLSAAMGELDKARQYYHAAREIFIHLGAMRDLQQLPPFTE
ncbi:MAG: tetratricopeptide repeat protein [Anaerolineaceae bacterium]|nr:tetratricopeptide repeat protein [Anaerolineaceae bacterium]